MESRRQNLRKKELKQDDNRQVVIYARKSKITHKGDSISNQEEYCKEYARLHLMLPEDYEFGIYEDEGKSGSYADRPDFQRMIHDVEHRKIKAIVCYKLDRISRRSYGKRSVASNATQGAYESELC